MAALVQGAKARPEDRLDQIAVPGLRVPGFNRHVAPCESCKAALPAGMAFTGDDLSEE